jgi:hypothetical protein
MNVRQFVFFLERIRRRCMSVLLDRKRSQRLLRIVPIVDVLVK